MRRLLMMLMILMFATNSIVAAEPAVQPKATLIFNGSDLTGWELYNRHGSSFKEDWFVNDGCIVCREHTWANLTYRETPMPAEFDFEFEWYVPHGDEKAVGELGSLNVLFHRSPRETEGKLIREAQLSYRFHLGSGSVMLATNFYPYYEPGDPAVSENLNAGRGAKPTSQKKYGVWHRGRIVWSGGNIEHWVDGKKVLEVRRRDVLDVKESHREGGVNLWDVAQEVPRRRRLYLAVDEFDTALRFRNLRLTVPNDSSRSANRGDANSVFSSPPLPR